MGLDWQLLGQFSNFFEYSYGDEVTAYKDDFARNEHHLDIPHNDRKYA